jgi:phage regulator Rha-like protein
MSSREIAELTGKNHKNVLADVRKMLEALGQATADFSATAQVPGPNSSTRSVKVFNLPKRETLILVYGYSVQMRAKNSRRPGHSWEFAPQCR